MWITNESSTTTSAPPPNPEVSRPPTASSLTAPSAGPDSRAPEGSTPTSGRRASSTGPSRTQPPGTSTDPAGNPAPAEADLLKRVEPTPDGVPAQVEVFLGGDGGCLNDDEPGPPTITGVDSNDIIPTRMYPCFDNFDLSSTLTVTLTPPTGPAITRTLPPLRDDTMEYSTSFLVPPGSPPGTYRLSAEQGTQKAAVDSVLALATSPKVMTDIVRRQVVAGDDVNVFLGGFPPNRPVTLHLYGSSSYDNLQPYRTSINVQIDPRGEGHLVIDTKPDDPLGCYSVTAPTASHPCSGDTYCPIDGFCLVRNLD